jgi:hypothetical protein
MKIHMTMAEIENIVGKALNLDASVKFQVVVDPTPAILGKIHSALGSLPDVGMNRIARIKALREATADHKHKGWIMNLATAKYAIENFEKFIKYVTKNGDLPEEYTDFV